MKIKLWINFHALFAFALPCEEKIYEEGRRARHHSLLMLMLVLTCKLTYNPMEL